jgi:radical SAM superfamily enzyme YgiQ (UPF0313 family)
MNILLVNSPLFDVPGMQHEDSLPPLGLGYLATSVKNAGLEVELLDAVADDCGTEGVICAIQSFRPKFVGLNVFTTNLELVQKIVTAPFDAHVIIGGPAVRALVDIVLGWETVNPITVIEGEAEHALPAFLKGQIVSQPWLERRDRSVLRIPADHSLFPCNIDLPLRREFFQNEPIFDAIWRITEAHIITSRGCGHNCAFCAAARSVNQLPIRFRSEGDIRKEIEQLRILMPDINCIRIIDDLFIRNRSAIKRACGLFRDTELSWRAMAHVSGFRGMDRALYDEMRRSGCLELFVGVESGSPARRKTIGKPSEIEPTVDMVTNLLRSGISVKAYFVFGFPGETKQEMEDTYAVARTMADAASRVEARFRTSVFKFRPYHGTRIHNELVASGAEVGRITGDLQLSTNSGRHQFSFMSENYSCVDLDTLNGFILATQEIGV